MHEFVPIPIEGRTSILKLVEKEAFLMKPKHQNHLSQWRKCDYGAQSWKKRRLLCESMFFRTERWVLILKIIESDVFLMKPKHRNHLSQQGERAYNAQSWKEMRLSCESVFIPIERRTSILKWLKNKFFSWNQSIKNIYPNEQNVIMVPNDEKDGDYYLNPCLPQLKGQFKSEKW